VHALLSLHVVPSRTVLVTHCPVMGLQSPAVVVHCVGSGLPRQMTKDCPTQLPPWQISPSVQALPSLHVVPSAFVVNAH
jgi:hypothetical protein